MSVYSEIYHLIEETCCTPFTKQITNVWIRDAGKLRLPFYKEKTDPTAHMTAFRISVIRGCLNDDKRDASYCRLFVEHLSALTLEWFSKLEEGSIDKFDQLSMVFMKHCSMYVEAGALDPDLCSLQQGAQESLRTFMTRFKDVMSKIRGISNAGAIVALKNAV